MTLSQGLRRPRDISFSIGFKRVKGEKKKIKTF